MKTNQTEVVLVHYTKKNYYEVACRDLDFVVAVDTLEDAGRELVDFIKQNPMRIFTVKMEYVE